VTLWLHRNHNIVRLSRLLGHHAPSFTLNRYGHLLDDGMAKALPLDAELAAGENKVSTSPTALDSSVPDTMPAELAAYSQDADHTTRHRTPPPRS